MEISAWLARLGLSQYLESFRANAVDSEVLPKLTAEDLREIGVVAVGDRRKLLDAIAELRAPAPAAAPAAAVAAPAGERREVAVLFADLVGSTALANELGAEAMHALLQNYFEVMDRIVVGHGGRVDKHIGDAVMGVFGAPVAHGNDVERAAEAAMAMKQAMADLSAKVRRPLRVHVAVASGDVVASDTGSDSHREYTVTGDVVNLAARLLDAAAADEIVISDAARQSLGGKADVSDAGLRTLKGFPKAERLWRLLGWKEAAEDEHPFVGRGAELRLMESALDACHGDDHGQCIYIRGEAGIGKTRLADECELAARERGFAVHRVQALDYGSSAGRDPIRALARSLAGIGARAEGETAIAGAVAALAANLVAADKALFLHDLFGVPQTAEMRGLFEAMDMAAREDGRHRTLRDLIANAAAGQPRVLMVEDVHWCDAAALAYLAAIAETATSCRAVLVLTSRIDGDPLDTGLRGRLATVSLSIIELGPLRRDEALALAAKLGVAGSANAAAFVDRANGNPLFLEQLLQSASANNGVPVSGQASANTGVPVLGQGKDPNNGVPGLGQGSANTGVPVLGQGKDANTGAPVLGQGGTIGDLPSSIRSVILARIDGLDPADRKAIQAASVLGQRFTTAALRHLLGDPTYDCGRLVRQRLLRPDAGELAFSHALVREGIASSLLKARRQELHRRAADWFADRDKVVFAEHLEGAGDQRAADAYLAAAREQAAAYRDEKALGLVERGLRLAASRAETRALTALEGQLLHSLGRIPPALAAYRRALDNAESGADRCDAWIGLAECMRIEDRFAEAFAILDDAEAAALKEDLKAHLSRIHWLRGNLLFPLGDVDACHRSHSAALRYALEVGSPELEANALSGLGDAEYARSQLKEAHEYFRRCVAIARAHGLQRIEAANLAMVAFTTLSDDFKEVLHLATVAMEAALRVGHRRAAMIARNQVCFTLVEMLELDATRPHFDLLISEARALGARRFEAQGLAIQSELYLAEGNKPAATDVLLRALAISGEVGFAFAGALILGNLARATDDRDRQKRYLADGETALSSGALSHNRFYFYRSAIEASLEAGDFDAADRYAEALEKSDRLAPLPWAPFFVRRGRALAQYGRGRRDQDLRNELRLVRDAGQRIHAHLELRAIEAALAGASSAEPLSA